MSKRMIVKDNKFLSNYTLIGDEVNLCMTDTMKVKFSLLVLTKEN